LKRCTKVGEEGCVARIAKILIPRPLPEPFDYSEPHGLDLRLGQIVAAPLGPRLTVGVVVDLRDAAGGNRPLKPVAEILDIPPLPTRTIEFIDWAARYSVDSPGQALAIALRGLRAPRPSPERRLALTGRAPARLTPARQRVIEQATSPLPAGELARSAAVSPGVVKGLVDEGVLHWVVSEPATPAPGRTPPGPAPLNPSQAAAATRLNSTLAEGGFSVTLLDGVTGSGKTEVYLEVAAAILATQPQAQILILLPEIALTQALIDRVTDRFGVAPAEWHSGVTPPGRRKAWEDVAEGRARIVVGARSALFLPFKALRLIVVDEEHDGSYKQEDGFIYQGRDLAVARAKIESCAIVLASATPSLETLWNAQTGRYRWLRLADRHGAAEMPAIELLDMREAPPETGQWLSPRLARAVAETLSRGEQTLLFLNRRGYAPVVLCRACGHRLKAPDTDSWLVEHRYSGRLVCHLTGFSMAKPTRCPSCGAHDALVSVGPGVERIEEEARLRFPQARLAVFSSDTVADPRAAKSLVQSMESGEIDILVATQGAAKGHNFPNLTLVGVIDADLGLRGGDPRAAEKTFQLLTQVSGRAGRHDRPGRALIQTWTPDHPVMQAIAAGDRDAFVALELAEREAAGLPPFGRLAAIIVSGPNAAAVEAHANRIAACAPNAAGVDVFGPADAPLAMIRGNRRKRLLVRADRSVDLQGFLTAWRARARPPSSVRVTIDVDPYSFL
jgi:primosomal protein N' (replication factor Y)